MISKELLHNKFLKIATLFILFTILAGNVTNSFFLKWGFREDFEPPLIVQILDKSITKPWAFRSFLPLTASSIVDLIPPTQQQSLHVKIIRHDSLRMHYFPKLDMKYWDAKMSIVYHILYVFVFWAFWVTLLVIYKFNVASLNMTDRKSAISLIIFSFIYPLTFQNGGYYYDFVELLGLLLSTYYFMSNQMYKTTLVLFIASFNKETMFIYAIFLYFLHDHNRTLKFKIQWSGIQILLSFIVYFYLRNTYQNYSGGIVEVHFFENIWYWINPLSYIQFSNLVGKGVATPELNNVLFLLPLLYWGALGWKKTTSNKKMFFIISFVTSFILLIFFGYRNEIRNLSLAFPAFYLILAAGGTDFFDRLFASEQISIIK